MDAFNDLQGNIDGHFTIGELCPTIFVVRPDRRGIVLRKRELETAQRIYMTVGKVMNCLSQRPPAVAIRSIELCVRKSLDCGLQADWQLSDRIDIPGARRERRGVEFTDRKSWVKAHFLLTCGCRSREILP